MLIFSNDNQHYTDLYLAIEAGDLEKTSVGTSLNFQPIELSELICAALRHPNLAVLKHLITQPLIKEYLTSDTVYEDIPDTLNCMIMTGFRQKVCEFTNALWPNGAADFSAWILAEKEIMELVDRKQSAMFFSYTRLSENLNAGIYSTLMGSKRPSLPHELVGRIFAFLEDSVEPLTHERLLMASLLKAHTNPSQAKLNL